MTVHLITLAVGFFLGAYAYYIYSWFDQLKNVVPSCGIPSMRNPPEPPPVPGIKKPTVHKLTMADNSIRYEVRSRLLISRLELNTEGRIRRENVEYENIVNLKDDQGVQLFETLAEAENVRDTYYQKKLSETIINDTVI